MIFTVNNLQFIHIFPILSRNELPVLIVKSLVSPSHLIYITIFYVLTSKSCPMMYYCE